MPIPTTTFTATTAKPNPSGRDESPGFFGRFVAAACALACLLLATVAARTSLAALYTSVARDVAANTQGSRAGAEAAQIAVRLAPWRTASHLALAQSLSAIGQTDAAIEHARQAARGTPADGYVWAYLARLLGARLAPSDDLSALYEMALSRTPNAAPLHRAIALDGVLRWRLGDDRLRRLWRASMAHSLRTERRDFLLAVARMGRDPYWCAANEDHLPIRKWCAQARFARNSCRAPRLPDEAAAWCRQYGLAPSPP